MFFFPLSFDIVTQGQDIQLVSMDSAEPASLWMESNMEDNSGLDLICARNSLSNGLLSETNPTTLSDLGRLKVEKVVTLVHQVTFKNLSANSANVCCFVSCCLPLGKEKIRLRKNFRTKNPPNIFLLNASRDWMLKLKMGNIRVIIHQFSNPVCCEKCLKDNKHNSLRFSLKTAWIFVLEHYLFLEVHSFSFIIGKLFASRKRKCPRTNIRAQFRQIEVVVYRCWRQIKLIVFIVDQIFLYLGR